MLSCVLTILMFINIKPYTANVHGYIYPTQNKVSLCMSVNCIKGSKFVPFLEGTWYAWKQTGSHKIYFLAAMADKLSSV